MEATPRTSPSQTPPTQPTSLSGEAQMDTLPSPALLASPLGANSLAGQTAVVQLLQALGRGHSLLAQYKSREAIAAFGALPAQQYQTSWVLSQVGKAYFELVDYAQALHFFTWSRNQDPYRVEGLEWHSTVLWHMKKEVRIWTHICRMCKYQCTPARAQSARCDLKSYVRKQ